MIVAALLVGCSRFALTLLGAPRAAVYAASLTAVQIIGALYLPLRLARTDLGYLQLWIANILVFALCQALIVVGLAYTYATGIPTFYHETERLRSFLGYDPTPAQHIGMHVFNWIIINPVIATWIVGAPILYFLRRYGRGGTQVEEGDAR
jgi:hypothetical protein